MTKSGNTLGTKSGDVEVMGSGDAKGAGTHPTDARKSVEMAWIHKTAMGSGNVETAVSCAIVNWAEWVWVAGLLVEAVGSDENRSGRRHQGAGVAGVELEGGVGAG